LSVNLDLVTIDTHFFKEGKMNNEFNEKRNKEKLDFFCAEKVEVHVKLNNKTFLNGFIEKKLREGVYWFNDRELKGIYLFVKDVYDVDKYTKEEEGK